MSDKPIQDFYPFETAVCFGCGRNNEHGLHVQTFWDGEVGIARFMPKPHHTAFPGIVYGGIIASIIDCHSIGTAIAAMYQAEGRAPNSEPEITCVTANLNVTYIKPTPMGNELVLRSTIKELSTKKAIVNVSVFVGEEETVKAEIVAVRVRTRANAGDLNNG